MGSNHIWNHIWNHICSSFLIFMPLWLYKYLWNIHMIFHTIFNIQSDLDFNVYDKNKNAPSERISTHWIMQVTGWKVVIRAKCGNAHWTKWGMHQTNEELHIGKSGLMARRHSWRIIWKNWPNKILRFLKNLIRFFNTTVTEMSENLLN